MTPPAAKHPRLEAAIAVLEEAYVVGNDVAIYDKRTGKMVTIANDAIPTFRQMLTSHSAAPDQRIAEAIEKLGELTRCKHMMSDGTCRYDEVCSMCNISDYEGQMYQVRELLALLKAVQ